ncbi:Phosphotriesterase homology protein [bacterium HR25]|nr:Phosphotriesterase homology protein [bacterium HR25]
MQVQTVRGPVDSSQLGVTLMHEHVFVLSEGVAHNFPSVWDAEAWVPEAVRQLKEAAREGVRTIVDLTVMGLGRDVRLLRRVAEQVPEVNIVVATGLYTYDLPPQYFLYRPVEHMAALFVRDIREGIQGTDIKAAIIKCATDEPGVTKGVEKVLRAVARAQRETGVPISTHTHAGRRVGLEQQRIFKEEGVDLGRVVIGHSGDTDDYDYLEALIDNGSYIGMDRFGVDVIFPFEKRVEVVAEMCRRGYAERMVLSHDYSVYMDWFPLEGIRRHNPRWSYVHIHRDVLPALRERGVTEAQIQQMLVENPRRIFEGR